MNQSKPSWITRLPGRLATLFCAMSTVALSMTGCMLDENTDDAWTDEAGEIVQNLRLAGFPDSEIEVRDDGVVIAGGDAVVTLQASREMSARASDKNLHEMGGVLKHYRTNNLVSSSVGTICINGSAYTGGLSTALNNAITNYNNEHLSFQMVRTSGSTTGCDAVITGYTQGGTGASAGFPSNGLPYGSIYMGTAIEPNYGVAVATHVVMHELGHAVGFRHTDYYNRSISCGSGGSEGGAGVGAVHIPNTPTTAVYNGSVMNACYNSSVNGQWANDDRTALSEMYGRDTWSPTIWSTGYSNTYGWAASPSYWGTISYPDIDGDGKDDVCGRGISGVSCDLSSGTSFVSSSLWTTNYSNAQGWNTADYYWRTIQFQDVNGDGKDDVCGRGSGGVSCALSTGSSFGANTTWTFEFSDALGWNGSESYWGTIRFPDINGDGKADICGRGIEGLLCAVSTGSAFGSATWWTSQYSNDAGWQGSESYWRTIQFPDVNGDGKDDVCGRGISGIVCNLSTGSAFGATTVWNTGFSNANGWSANDYHWGTIRFPDINGDGKDDVCGRGGSGVFCGVSTGSAFATVTNWASGFSNANGWNAHKYYWGTIRFPDINGDGKADICGRGGAGVSCGLSSGTTFSATTLWAAGYSDAGGWNSAEHHWGTIRYPDLNGDGNADICGRASSGLYCSQ